MNLNDTVTVEMPLDLAFFLMRLGNVNGNTFKEFAKTERFIYATKGEEETPFKEQLEFDQKKFERFYFVIRSALAGKGVDAFERVPAYTVADYEVKFRPDHIMVGCKKVTNEQILELAKRQKLV